MKVLVTGGAGYVGMNVVEALLARQTEVALLDAGELTAPIAAALAPHGALVDVIRADIRDAAQLERAFAGRRIDGVIHCAAVTAGAQREAREPASSVEVNQLGKIATWGLYASVAFVLVTARDTQWPQILFWISLGLALLSAVQYLAKARREVHRRAGSDTGGAN